MPIICTRTGDNFGTNILKFSHNMKYLYAKRQSSITRSVQNKNDADSNHISFIIKLAALSSLQRVQVIQDQAGIAGNPQLPVFRTICRRVIQPHA